MIHSVLDFCLRQRLLIVLLSVALLGYGWYSAQQVPIDAIPNVGENQVIVLTEWAVSERCGRPDYISTFDCVTGGTGFQKCPWQKHVRL